MALAFFHQNFSNYTKKSLALEVAKYLGSDGILPYSEPYYGSEPKTGFLVPIGTSKYNPIPSGHEKRYDVTAFVSAVQLVLGQECPEYDGRVDLEWGYFVWILDDYCPLPYEQLETLEQLEWTRALAAGEIELDPDVA